MNKLTYIETEERRREVGKRSQYVRVKNKTAPAQLRTEAATL